jgi:hypothetical protein
VQQQETVTKAAAAAAKERKIRVMECGGRFFLGKLRNSEKPSAYFDGATYPGADGAGADLLWQQEVAANVPAATAANAAIFTSFMMVIGGWFLSVLAAMPKECSEPNGQEGSRKENRGG